MKPAFAIFAILLASCEPYPPWGSNCTPVVTCLDHYRVEQAQLQLLRCQTGWRKRDCTKQRFALQDAMNDLSSDLKESHAWKP